MTSSAATDLLGRLAYGRDGRLLHVHEVPARPSRSGQWPSWLPADVIAAYATAGVTLPWQHQLEAAELARSGEHVALATGTASGKSIGFGRYIQ